MKTSKLYLNLIGYFMYINRFYLTFREPLTTVSDANMRRLKPLKIFGVGATG